MTPKYKGIKITLDDDRKRGTIEWEQPSPDAQRPPSAGDHWSDPFDLSDYVYGNHGQAKWISEKTEHRVDGFRWSAEFELI